MRYWLLRRPPHYTEINISASGTPRDYDKVSMNVRLKSGDIAYLMAAYGELYGWGIINKKEAYHDNELHSRAYNISVLRVVVRPDLVKADDIKRTPELASLLTDSELNLLELMPPQANAFNQLLRTQGVEAPSDMEDVETDVKPVKTYNFPHITIPPETRIWLEALYDKLKLGKKVEPSEMIVELWGKIPEDYEYKNIDKRLAMYGLDLTLLGVLHVDPSSELAEEADQVIRFIQKLILSNPRIETVTAEEISEGLSIQEVRVFFILNFIRHLGRFWNGASGHADFPGYTSITIKDENVKREYLRYKGLEDLLEKFYKEVEPEQQKSQFRDDMRTEIDSISSTKNLIDESKAENENGDIPSYNFPKIELSEAEQEWLGTVTNQFLRGHIIDVDHLKKSWQLKGKWPRGFRPFAIDRRLLRGANEPTLLGVWHAYPVNKWIPKCDELIRYIKGRIEASTSAKIKVSDIAGSLGLPERSVSILIRLLPSLGLYYTGTLSSARPHNYVQIPGEMSIYTSLQIDDPEKIDDYLDYEDIEQQVRKVFGEDSEISVSGQDMNSDNLILGRYELIRPLIGFKQNIESQLTRFSYEENVFLMMKFRPSNKELSDYIIENLEMHGLRGVRADAREWNITKNVYNPIAALYCCKYGIALFDEPEEGQAYSPNVAYELGIMHYQQKECLILRHSSLSAVPFDLVKDLYVTYEKDLQVKRIIADWVLSITNS